jgi:methionyl-tRNA formyltransferase
MVRAYTPWPGAYTHWRGKLLKIVSAHALTLDPDSNVVPGTVSVREEDGHPVLAVVTGAGFLLVQQLQLEGKRAMSAEEFLRGYPQISASVLT